MFSEVYCLSYCHEFQDLTSLKSIVQHNILIDFTQVYCLTETQILKLMTIDLTEPTEFQLTSNNIFKIQILPTTKIN